MFRTFWIGMLATLFAAEIVNAAPLRLMSFNIRYGTAKDGPNSWEHRREFLIATIREQAPDLLGTQETLAFQKDYLAAELPGYGVAGVGRDDGQQKGEMMAVYYRKERFDLIDSGHFWLSETPAVAGSKSWDSSLPRMVTWLKLRDKTDPDQPELLWFNTHYDHMGKTARLESSRLLRRRAAEVANETPVLVTGDFNAGEQSAPYAALFGAVEGQASPLRDAYRVSHPERQPDEGTFSNFLETQRRGDRIDWIAVSSHWKVRSCEILRTAREGRTPSDHFPVLAILERQ